MTIARISVYAPCTHVTCTDILMFHAAAKIWTGKQASLHVQRVCMQHLDKAGTCQLMRNIIQYLAGETSLALNAGPAPLVDHRPKPRIC
jgi:hypothetical protein